jgi:hypothetical protein
LRNLCLAYLIHRTALHELPFARIKRSKLVMPCGKGADFLLDAKQSGNEILHPRPDLNQQRSFFLTVQGIRLGTSMVQPNPQPFFAFPQKFQKCLIQFNESFTAIKVRKIHSESKRERDRIGCRQDVGSRL